MPNQQTRPSFAGQWMPGARLIKLGAHFGNHGMAFTLYLRRDGSIVEANPLEPPSTWEGRWMIENNNLVITIGANQLIVDPRQRRDGFFNGIEFNLTDIEGTQTPFLVGILTGGK